MMRLLAIALLGVLGMQAFAQDAQFPLPPKEWPAPVHDSPVVAFVFLDRFEYQAARGADTFFWDVQGWIGSDYNKLWLKSEGDRTGGRTESWEAQALYARLIAPFWYLQAGVRGNPRPEPSRNSVVLAVQGLAPYWFDVEASAFLDEKGKLSGRFEAEYDQLLTQRLILQPRMESNFAASGEEERGVGRGLNDLELGLRLRYEFRRQFAPYVGVNWKRQLGATADLSRQAGEDVSEKAVVFGLRVWL